MAEQYDTINILNSRTDTILSLLPNIEEQLNSVFNQLQTLNNSIFNLPIDINVITRDVELTPINSSMSYPDEIAHLDIGRISPYTPSFIPNFSKYNDIISDILKELPEDLIDKFIDLLDISFNINKPELPTNITLPEPPEITDISNITMYLLQSLSIPEPDISTINIDIPKIDYFKPDDNPVPGDIINAIRKLNKFLDKFIDKEKLSINHYIEKLWDKVADDIINREYFLRTKVVYKDSCNYSFNMPIHHKTGYRKGQDIFANETRLATLQSITNDTFIELFKSKQDILRKYNGSEIELELELKRSILDIYYNIIKDIMNVINIIFETQLAKVEVDIKKSEVYIKVYSIYFEIIDRYIKTFQEILNMARLDVKYNSALVESVNSKISEMEALLNIDKAKLDMYKMRIDTIRTKLEAEKLKVEKYRLDIENLRNKESVNEALLSMNQDILSLRERVNAGKITYINGKSSIADVVSMENRAQIGKETAKINTYITKVNALLRSIGQGAELQNIDARLKALQVDINKLNKLGEIIKIDMNKLKSRLATEINSVAYRNAIEGIRSNLNNIQTIMRATSELAQSGYKPLAGFALGLANSISVLANGLYEYTQHQEIF